ncbi:MAG: FAD-binding oxidoreductase [Myxococcota bacterium]
MRRRVFVKGAAAAALVGCGSKEEAPSTIEPATSTPAEPVAEPAAADPGAELGAEPAEATPATNADWARFGESLSGDLVRPDSDRYDASRRLFDPRFDTREPQGIAYCASPSDVQRCLAFARAHGLPIAARCGGHSYGGYSSSDGLICDVGPMANVDLDGTRARIGSGAKLIDIYARLAPRRMVIPGGTCPSVGVSGLTLGGGQGVFGRKFGLTCDAVKSIQVVTADGVIRDCDAETNADLFWAHRGGGGGNFGIVTAFAFEASAVGEVTRFALPFPWDAAADVVAAWQEWGPSARDELWSKVELGARGDRRSVAIHGVFLGSENDLRAVLAPLLQQTGRPRRTRVERAPLLETMLILGGCARRTYEECHLPPEGTLGRGVRWTRSGVFHTLSTSGIEALLEGLDRTGLEGSGRVALDALGGAIGRVAPEATAFPHRRARMIAQYAAYWSRRAPATEAEANRRWIDALYDAMQSDRAGAYANYIDPVLRGWQDAYYGANLTRLRALKARFDPDGVFRFDQGISPA